MIPWIRAERLRLFARRCGQSSPLDLVIIMLGTNDTKSYYRRTPYEVAVGMSKLVAQVLTSAGE